MIPSELILWTLAIYLTLTLGMAMVYIVTKLYVKGIGVCMSYYLNREKGYLGIYKYRLGEIFYMQWGVHGLEASVSLPTKWHENGRGWVRLSFGLFRLAFSFKSKRIYPDYGQCSGPRYGFQFFDDTLWIYHGQDTGYSKDPKKTISIYMPWHWEHVQHNILSEPETHNYTYILRSGDVQHRKATIQVETREWRRKWIPWKDIQKSIIVSFDGEVGEQSGSWKGGCTGCGFGMKKGETALQALRRMESTRKF